MLLHSVYLHENHWIFIKQASFREMTDFNQFSKDSLLLIDGFSCKIVCFRKNTNFLRQMLSHPICFSEILQIFIKQPFSRDSLPLFGVSVRNIKFSRNFLQNTNFFTVMLHRLIHSYEYQYFSLVFNEIFKIIRFS